MSSYVIDASAILALVHGEPGGDLVAERLDGSAVSAVNWSEVVRHSAAQKVALDELRHALLAAGMTVAAFDRNDAEEAAALWKRTKRAGLSLADGACLVLASRLGAPAVTADRVWTKLDLGVEIVCIR